jgi:hypothetical protein
MRTVLKAGWVGIGTLLCILALAFAAQSIISNVSAAAPTPSPGAMTIYQISHSNPVPLSLQQAFYRDGNATPVYQFSDTIPISTTKQYHVNSMAQIVSPFSGTLIISAPLPFTAEVIGYDYPPTSTPTITPTRTASPTASPTATASPTRTPTATPIRTVLPIRK